MTLLRFIHRDRSVSVQLYINVANILNAGGEWFQVVNWVLMVLLIGILIGF